MSCDIRYICPAEQASAAGFVEFEGKLRICQLPLPPVLSAGEMLHRLVGTTLYALLLEKRSCSPLPPLQCAIFSEGFYTEGVTFCPRDSAQSTATHDIPHIARRHATAARCHRGSGKDSPYMPPQLLPAPQTPSSCTHSMSCSPSLLVGAQTWYLW